MVIMDKLKIATHSYAIFQRHEVYVTRSLRGGMLALDQWKYSGGAYRLYNNHIKQGSKVAWIK